MHLSSTILALAALATPLISAAELSWNPVTPDTTATPPRTINVSVSVDFPLHPADLSPIKLTNGLDTPITLTISNHEEEPIGVRLLQGSLWNPLTLTNIRNLTAKKLTLDVAKGETREIPYKVNVDMHPQELLLNLQLVLRTGGKLVAATAFNETVAIVEQPLSLLDPQMFFLYILLLSGIGGAGYYLYNMWLDSVSPKKRRSGTTAPRAAATPKARAESPSGAATATGVEGGKKFDESWIPEHHIKRPQSGARRK